MIEYGGRLEIHHARMLKESGITPDHARARGYVTVDTKKRLDDLGVTKAGRRVPGLLVPQLRPDGSIWGYQYRPDDPRLRNGKPCKYETPTGQRNGIDVPPGVGERLDDPSVPLWVTEGVKKADAGALAGLCIVALPGVWSWLGTNPKGGKVAIPDWRDIALNGRRVILAFDSDVVRKRSVRNALDALAGYLASKGAEVAFCHLPDDDDKAGLDDYLVAGHDADDLWKLVRPEPPEVVELEPTSDTSGSSPLSGPSGSQERHGDIDRRVVNASPVALTDALAAFRSWLHIDDEAPVLAVAAAVVANLADGDPVWLLVVGPPSGGKTEILSSTSALNCVISTATITEAALLSGTSSKERAKDATGGLLRQIGSFGIVLAKDFTSVLSQNKDTAKAAMAALREVYDGSWDRPVGTDGGRVLRWSGKCGFIGGVTPSYDRYGSVVNALGDRYLLLRLPDVDARAQALSALAQAENEKPMRAALAEAMTGLIASADRSLVHAALSPVEVDGLVHMATFAARARTTVERDGYTGELLVVPQAEGPARLVKALRRMYGALAAIGVDEPTRWSVMTRIAVDCAPAIRVPLIRALLAVDEPARTSDIAGTVGMVTKTAGRQLDDLAMLGIAERTKKSDADNSPDLWSASAWLREYWPEKVGQRTTTRREEEVKEATDQVAQQASESSTSRRSLSHSDTCRVCGEQLHALLIRDGVDVHEFCIDKNDLEVVK